MIRHIHLIQWGKHHKGELKRLSNPEQPGVLRMALFGVTAAGNRVVTPTSVYSEISGPIGMS